MAGKRRLPIPNEQLAFADIEPVPPKKKKPGVRYRTAILEERVTHLEAEVTLIRGQLDRDEDDD